MADDPTISRRGLFRGLGTAATVAAGCKVASDPPPSTTVPGTSAAADTQLRFTLDGVAVDTKVEHRTTLADLLRVGLEKTATKVVCDRGACGACMVLVDGVPKNSCMMLALDAEGTEITTAAGLSQDGKLTVLQQKFVERDAMQCGFCTPGMVISCSALLQRAKGPVTEAQVQDAIAGNLCRCGTYPHVIQATVEASKGGA